LGPSSPAAARLGPPAPGRSPPPRARDWKARFKSPLPPWVPPPETTEGTVKGPVFCIARAGKCSPPRPKEKKGPTRSFFARLPPPNTCPRLFMVSKSRPAAPKNYGPPGGTVPPPPPPATGSAPAGGRRNGALWERERRVPSPSAPTRFLFSLGYPNWPGDFGSEKKKTPFPPSKCPFRGSPQFSIGGRACFSPGPPLAENQADPFWVRAKRFCFFFFFFFKKCRNAPGSKFLFFQIRPHPVFLRAPGGPPPPYFFAPEEIYCRTFRKILTNCPSRGGCDHSPGGQVPATAGNRSPPPFFFFPLPPIPGPRGQKWVPSVYRTPAIPKEKVFFCFGPPPFNAKIRKLDTPKKSSPPRFKKNKQQNEGEMKKKEERIEIGPPPPTFFSPNLSFFLQKAPEHLRCPFRIMPAPLKTPCPPAGPFAPGNRPAVGPEPCSNRRGSAKKDPPEGNSSIRTSLGPRKWPRPRQARTIWKTFDGPPWGRATIGKPPLPAKPTIRPF